MATTKIAAAIQSIPEKKESLRKAFEALQSYPSALASFSLEWKDLDAHFSTLEKSVEARFKDLRAKEIEKSSAVPAVEKKPAPAADVPVKGTAEPESSPRPELVSLCAKMDGKGLRSFISDHRKELDAIRCELNPALRSAPDPALLVLDAMDDFYPPKPVSDKDGPTQAIRRTCVNLLECVQAVAPEIKPALRERAKKLATEWRDKMSDGGGDNGLEAMGFLQLLVSYGLFSEFKVDDLLDLLVLVSRRRQIIDLCKNLGLTENVTDLIQKLSNKGKQLDAVKVVYAFNLLDKYPPVPLLKAYIKEVKKAAQEVRKKGNNSTQSQNEAIAKELGALKSVLKAVEEYKLETEYPREILEKRITQLEQEKAEKKRTAAAAAVLSSKTQQLQQSNKRPQKQQLQQPNKRPRPSTTTSAPAVAAHPLPPLGQSQYMGMAGAGSYRAATGSLYNPAGSNLSGTPMGLGGNRSPPRSYLYSSESFAGTGGLYDRPTTYSGYTLPSYSASLYP